MSQLNVDICALWVEWKSLQCSPNSFSTLRTRRCATIYVIETNHIEGFVFHLRDVCSQVAELCHFGIDLLDDDYFSALRSVIYFHVIISAIKMKSRRFVIFAHFINDGGGFNAIANWQQSKSIKWQKINRISVIMTSKFVRSTLYLFFETKNSIRWISFDFL